MDWNKLNVQFYHSINPNPGESYTISVEVPPKEVLEELIKLGTAKHIWLNIGKTKLHPKDRYIKETGRQMAINRNQRIKFYLEQATFEDECIYIRLVDTIKFADSAVKVIQVRIFKCGAKPHLIYAR